MNGLGCHNAVTRSPSHVFKLFIIVSQFPNQLKSPEHFPFCSLATPSLFATE